MKRWLLLEDELDLYEVLLTIYAIAGYQGVALSNGEDMINWIDDVDNGEIDSIDIQFALLDIRLPGKLSGVDVAARLRESPYLWDIVIILMTAYRLSPAEEEAVLEESGADLLLYKPIPHRDEMLKMIEEIRNSRQYR
ncbi:MAG: response regulator [Chloroflexi bacterium]|nr:MAG: response regulator [Chloroflexota bacterium]